jgi:hypothetical protein
MNSKSSGNPYKAVLTIVIGFCILGYIMHSPKPAVIGIIIGVLALLHQSICNIIVFGWEKLGLALGWVNSKILLTLIYFVFLFPMALLKKLFTKKIAIGQSNFYTRNNQYNANDLKNKW